MMNTNTTKILPLLFFLFVLGGVIFLLRSRSAQLTSETSNTPPAPETPAANCIPTFADGGGPYYLANAPFRTELAPETTTGDKLVVSGRVLARDCQTPMANVIVDIWQANESGNYDDEWYRGRVTTNSEGEYEFATVIPKGYGEGTAFRPPHIHFKIWQNGKELITSQMFLPASRAQGIEEAYIMELNGQRGYHDIVLP